MFLEHVYICLKSTRLHSPENQHKHLHRYENFRSREQNSYISNFKFPTQIVRALCPYSPAVVTDLGKMTAES